MLLLIMGLDSQYINKSHLILHPFSPFRNIKKDAALLKVY
jgi:hypothetical protein